MRVLRIIGIVLADIGLYGSNFIKQSNGHTIHSYLRVRCFWFSGLVACSHADFAGTDLSFFLSNGSRTKLFETYFANSGDSPYYGYLL